MKVHAIRRQRSLFARLPIFGLSLCGLMPGVAPVAAQTLPTGGQVVVGNAAIERSGMSLTVHQDSDKAIIDWNDFSIAKGANVRFDNGSGATLNRVTGTNASSIDGVLGATGSVYLINRNGIVFGREGRVDVGGSFVASTQNLTNEQFLAGGNLTLSGASEAAIVNYGKIGAAGGDVALVAAKVVNEGDLAAANGSVGLLAGYQVLLRDRALENGKFSVVVGGSGTSATNVGAIRAAEAELRAQSGNVYALAGNTGGIVNAQGVDTRGGRIFLTAEGGEAHLTGTLRAQAADGKGGAIEVTGKNVLLGDKALVDASGTTGGTVLIGGDWQGGSDRSLAVADHAIAHADAVVMADGAKIDVSGGTGAGGTAVLWSDAYTNFLGAIDAHGAIGGGRVETSSKGALQALGSVDAAGLLGAAGQWLLDPADITISSAATSGGNFAGTAPLTFTPSGTTSTANVATINSALNAGTNVLIATGSSGGGNGDITLASGTTISKSSGASNAKLTLNAYRSIVLNGAIDASGSGVGKLDVVLGAQVGSSSNVGSVSLNGNIKLNGGNLNVGSNANATDALFVTSGDAVTLGNAIIDAGGGNIWINGESASSRGLYITSGSSIMTSGAGSVFLKGVTRSTATYGITMDSSAKEITAGTGGLKLYGQSPSNSTSPPFLNGGSTALISSAGDIDINGDGVYLSNAVSATGATGKISIQSTRIGNLSVGAVTGPGDITLSSAGSISVGAIKQTGAGAILLSSVSALNVSSGITKTGGGNSTLTLKSNSDVTVSSAITASTGKLNVYLNSRAGDGASGAIAISKSITTLGGDIAAWGGSTAPDLTNLTAAGTAKGTGNTHGILISGSGTTLDAGGGNIGLAGEQTNSAAGNAGTAAVRIDAGAVVKTSGAGSIGVKGVGNANYGVLMNGALSTGDGSVNLDGSSAGAAFAGVGLLLTGSASITTGSGAITMRGTATGADSGLLLSNGSPISVTSTSGAINMTGTASGSNSVEGLAIISANGATISTGGSIALTASGGTTSFGSNRPKSALLMGTSDTSSLLTLSAGGNLTIKATAASGAASVTGYLLGGSTDGSIISAGGTLSINADADANRAIFFNNGTIAAGGATTIATSSGAITLRKYTSNGGAVSVKAADGLTIGDITLATSGNVDFSGATTSFGLITKKASATGASTLTIASASDISITNAITAEAGAGKLNVNLNSRSTDAASGIIYVDAAIKTGGGDLNLYGGSDAAKTGSAISSSGRGIALDSDSILDAGGGNILMRGAAVESGTQGIAIQGSILTSGQGGIMAVGTTENSNTGLIIGNATIAAGDGGIDFTGITTNAQGTAKDGAGIRINGSNATTITTTGDLSFKGTSTKFVGVLIDTDSTGSKLKGRNVTLTGTSLGGSDSNAGIYFKNANIVEVAADNKLVVTGTGGGKATPQASDGKTGGFTAAIELGGATKLTAGSGGVVLDATGADSGADYGVDTNAVVNNNATITSAGAITVSSNRAVYLLNAMTQTGGGASSINASNSISLSSFSGVNADDLILKSDRGSVTVLKSVAVTKNLNIRSGISSVRINGAATVGGALTITAKGDVNATTISQTGASGNVAITSAAGTISTGAIDVLNSGTTTLQSAGALTTGAITLNGASNVTLDAGAALTSAAITKKASATGASTLTLKSTDGITLANAINAESGAGKMDVTLSSRSGGAATGAIAVNANITTRGGKIVIGAGTDGSGEAIGDGTDGIAVAANVVLDARSSGTIGGAILMTGKASSGAFSGIDLGSGTSLLTNGAAGITLTGTSAGTLRGIDVNGTKIQTGTGAVTLTGTGTSDAGIGFLSGVSSVQTGGALTLKGTSSTGIGIFKKGSDALTLTGKDILLDGQSTGGANSAQGILLDGDGAITIDGTGDATLKNGSVRMNGVGGATAGSGNDSSKSAIAFGSTTYNTPVAVKAGSGGIDIDADMASGGSWGVDNFSPTGRANKITFDTSGSVDVASNGGLALYGKWTQTDASKASTMTSQDYIGLGRTSSSQADFKGALTLSAVRDLQIAALTMGTGELKATSSGAGAPNGSLSSEGITTSGAVTLTAARVITASTITQQAATNTGALTLNSAGSISMGAVNWATGDISLTSVSDLTPGAITKIAGAAGMSTLTAKSDGNVAISNAVQTGNGAGPLNVLLNSRAHDAASGTVAVSANVATGGGNITLRGGSAALSASPVNPTTSLSGFVTELTNTGTAITLSSGSLLSAGGGNIELRGTSATTGLNLTSGTLATTGTGAINLYGYSAATGSGAGSGVNITGANVSTVNGALTVLGATKQGATADAVHIENASVTSAKGNVLIAGANDSAASGSGNLTGVMLKSATVGITGSGATGTVTIAGQGGGGTAGSAGVYASASSIASTSSGATQITGVGGGGSGTSNYGLYLDQGSASAALVNTTGAGAVTLSGKVSGGTSIGIYQGPNNSAKIGGGGSGALTLIADKMALNNGSGSAALLNTTGALTVRAQTGGSLVIDGNILPALFTNNAYRANYSAVTFGAADGGSLTLNTTATANTYASPLTLASGSGGIAIAGTDALTASGGLTLNTTGAVTQAVDVNANALTGTAGSIALTRATNNLTALGALAVTNDLSFATKGALTVNGAVTTATGLIRAAGNLSLASGASVKATGSGTALQLTTGTKFVNNAGSGALSTPNGRWLLWSNKPADDTLGGLSSGFRQYAAVFGTTTPGLATGNGLMYTLSPTLSVQLTGTYARDYDGTTAATLAQSNFVVTGLSGSEQASVYSTASFDTKDVGSGKTVLADDLAVVVRDNGGKVFGYTLSTFSATGAIGKITPKALTASLTGNVSKVYDGGTSAVMDPTNYALSGVIGSEVVTLVTPSSGAFADKNAGTNKLVVATGLSLTGADAGNYTVATNASGNVGTITPKALTASLTGTISKTYDGTNVATLNTSSVALDGLIGNDAVTVANGLIGSYDDKNARTGKTVTVTAVSLTGADAANYTVGSTVSGAVGVITAKALTLTAVADTKIYDGTTASGGVVRATGLVGDDTVAATQVFSSRNAGNRTLQVANGYTISDDNGGANYVVTKGATASGTITKRLVTTTLTANDKVYDNGTAATGTFSALANKISGDNVSLDTSAGTLSFLDRHAGNGKAVTAAGYTLTGSAASNYTLAAIGNGAANITKATLTLIAVADSKTYDGTTASAGVVRSAGLLGGDTVTATQAFDVKKAGARTLSVANWTIADGNGGNNYVVVTQDSAGTIGKKEISGQLTSPISKVYDGTADAILSGASLQGVVGGDAVTVSATTARYADKNTGINKLVTVSGMALGGADGDNYILQSTDASGNVGTITARAVNATTTGAGAKTYDRTTTLTHGQIGTLALTAADADTRALMLADGVTFDGSSLHGTVTDRNAGTGKVATLTGFALVNNGANNYALASGNAQGIVDVARKALTLNAATDSKSYDGTTASGAIVQSAGLVAGDSVTATQAFDGKDAGARNLIVTSYSVTDGNDGANYSVTANNALGAIAKRAVTTTVSADDKVYDGTTVATGTFGTIQNVVAGEVLGATGTLTFADRNVGTGKTVTVSNVALTGADARNYTLNPVADGTAAISQAHLVLTAGADIKTYDGTTASAGSVVATGLATGDSFAATQHFDAKDAGVRLLTVDGGYSVDDGNHGANYIVTLAGTNGQIDKRVVATAVTVDTREYDGTTAATGTFGALQNVVAGETVTVNGGTLAFANRNAGTGKAVTVTGATLAGADAANYVLSDVANGTGTINVKELTLTAVADTKTYDGTIASGGTVHVDGLVAGDAVIANQVFDTKNTGRRWLQVDRYSVSDGNGGGNYHVVLGSGVLGQIDARVINASVSVDNKVYDGTTTASGSFNGLTGVVAGDVVNVDTTSGVLAFLDRNAGTGKAVTVTGATLGGADAGNYTLGSVGSGTANITKATLTLTAAADSRVYDGTRASSGTVTIAGLVGGDSATATQAFDTKNAGTRTLSADSWAIADGNDGGNYTVVKVDASGTIAARTISSALTGTVSKVYDGTTTATILPANLSGVVAGDAVTVAASSADYDDRNAGTNKLVTVTGMTLNGADALNYVLDQDHAAANVGTITARQVAVTTSGRGSKTYDGNTALGGTQLGSLAFLLADGDAVTTALLQNDGVAIDLSAVSGSFADRHVGTGKGVTLGGYALSNNAAGNYVLANGSVLGLADIRKATLTLTAAGDSRTYDGTRTSAGTVTIAGLVAGDTATATQTFDSKNAGSRALQVSDWTLDDGNDGGNYTVVKVDAAGTIAQKTISSALTGTVSKVYDGTTTATILPTNLSGVVAGDIVTVAVSSADYADRNAGTNKLVTVTGMTLNGTDALNYVLDQDHSSANVGTITARQVAVTASGRGAKTYDGTTDVAASHLGTLGFALADGDAVTQALLRNDGVALDASGVTGTLADRNAGTGKSAALSGFVLTNNGVGNFVLATVPVQGVIDVARQTLRLTAAADTKVYDGTLASTGSVASNGLVAGDTLVATQAFDTKNAGARALKVHDWTIGDGNDGGNYTVVTVDAAGTIDRRTVSSSVSANDKVYDGTVTATGTFGAIANKIAGDALTVAADLAFADRHAGVGKSVTVTNARLEGADAGNYLLDPIAVTGNRATINRANLVLTAGFDRKTYDGTTASTGTVQATGLIAGDSVVATQIFDAKNAGARSLQVDGWTVSDGNDGNNYLVSRGVATAGTIDRKALTAAFTVDTKVYDGATTATGAFTGFTGLIAGDAVTVDGAAATLAFADRNAGAGKTVYATGIALTGADASNYNVAPLAAGTGTITAKALTLRAVTDTKTYDGTTASAGRVQASGLVARDDFAATQSFDGRTAGAHDLQVDAGWRVLDGNGGGNYLVSLDQPAHGAIARRVIGAAVTVGNKVYDGTTTASGTVDGLAGLIAGDVVTVDGSHAVIAFADRNAGTGKTVTATGATLAGQDAGNYELGTVASGTADIERATLTLTASADSRVYDGTTASVGTVTAAGLVGGDTIDGTAQVFDTKNAGSRTLSVKDGYVVHDGNDGGNYRVVKVDASGQIGRKTLSGALTGAVSKVYDGTVDAVLAGANLTGVATGDRVTVAAANASYADANAGTGKLVTVTGMTLGGVDADNYVLSSNNASANVGEITARRVVLTTTGVGAKVYDGTIALGHAQLGSLAAQAVDADTRALMATDGVTFDDAGVGGVLADRHAGTAKVVTLSGYALSGNGAGNYVLDTGTAQGVADVARKTLLLNAATDSKTYDGTTASTALVDAVGLVAGDSATATQRFDGKDAGVRTLLVQDWTISDGNAGGNYAVTTVNAAGDIAKRIVTTTVHADNKVYDGTTAATGTFGTLANVVAGEALGITGTLTFADRHAGAGKGVTVTGATLTGVDARNYELSPVADGTAEITKAALLLTAGDDRRVYDGTLASAGTVRATGLMAGDAFTATQAFDGKDAGARTLSVENGWQVQDGNGGGNYTVTLATGAGIIDRRTLTTAVTVDDREYDGTTAATGTFGALQNVVAGEAVLLSGGTLAFADRNAGTGKAVTVAGATLSGADAANYVLANVAAGTGTVTRKALLLTAGQDSKVYDNTVASLGTIRATGLIAGDTATGTQVFDGKDVGARSLQIASWAVGDGNGGGNYVVSIDNPVAGTITPRALRAAAQVDDKTYDGTTTAVGRLTGLTGVLGNDDVTVGGSGQFTFVDRNAGAGKAVTVTGLSLSGGQAGNYMLDAVANGSATINKATLTLTASDDRKTYDGTRASTGPVTIAGLIAGDTGTAVQAFDTKNAGARTISADSWTIADGNGGGNYTIVKVDAHGTIDRKLLSGALSGTVSKAYDGTTAATLLGANLDGVIAGDAVDVSTSSAFYDGKDVGTGRLVTVAGMALSGRDADNYVLTSDHASANVGTITARAVTVTSAGRGAKTYDGSVALGSGQLGSLVLTAADGDAVTQALLANDGVTLDGSGVTGTLVDRNAGTGKSVTLGGYALNGNGLGNFVLASGTVLGVADVARAALTLTAAADTKTYDGTTTSAGIVAIGGLVGNDTATATQAFDGRNAGSRVLKVIGQTIADGNDGGNYIVRLVDASGSIDKRRLTTSAVADDRVYDGTIVATGHYTPLGNVVAGDAVAVTGGSMTFADRNVGTAKTVTVTGATLQGGDATNYLLDPIADTTASISRASLVLHAVADTRAYDRTTTSTGQVRAAGLAAGDSVTATQVFDGRNAGAHLLHVVDGSWTVSDGNGGGNYTVSIGDAANGAITQRVLTTGVTVDSREYDGTTAATGTFGGLFNVLAGDQVSLSGGTLAFADRNAGNAKAVTVTGASLSGTDAANYVLADVAAGTGVITRKALLLTAGQDTKVYDGTLASLGHVSATGLVGGDAVIGTQAFDGKDAGTHGLQVVSWTIADGNNGGNYVVSLDNPVTGTITARSLRAAASVDDKVYDGTTSAVGHLTGLTGVIGNDDVTVGGSGLFTFVDRNAGAGKAVTVTGLTLGGAQAGNYLLDTVANGSASITKAVLTLTASADRKVYDGTDASNGVVTVAGLVAGDTATATQAFDTKNAGARRISAANWTIADGNDGGNYAIVKVDANGTIDRKIIDGSLTGTVSKVYDGTDAAMLLGTNLAGVIAGDAVDVHAANAVYGDRNVGAGKTVTVTGMTLAGRDAANYDLTSDHASANVGAITPRIVTVAVTGRGAKTYDGTDRLGVGQYGTLLLTAADGDAATQALLAADGVTFDASVLTGTLADRNAGTGKSVTLTGYALGGNALGNYRLATDTLLGVADVARAALVLTASGDAKTYDGNVASLGTVAITGLVGSDTAIATQAFDSRNAGDRVLKVANYTVADGNDGGNYAVRLVDAAGSIARRLVTTSVTADDKVYDGTTRATGRYATLANTVAGDAVGVAAGTMTFADRNAGTGKTVTIAGTTLSGSDAGNYLLDTIADTTASIARAALVLDATTDTRAYDGTIVSAGQVRSTGLAAGDGVTATQVFDGKNAGARLLHVVDGSWTVADGNGGANYIVSVGGTAAGAITQRLLTTTATVNDKEYDGTTAATGTFGGLVNLIGADRVTLNGGTLAFVDRHAGIGKAVTLTGATLTGADAGNYALDTIPVGTATITPRALLLQAVSDTRIYDGTTASAGTVLASGLVAGDTVSAIQRFDSRHAGSNLLQVADGWVIGDGNAGGNYVVSRGQAVAGTIDRRIVSASVAVQDKVYDGTTVATGTIGALSNAIAGDDIALDAGAGTMRFLDRNAGAGKAVVLDGIALSGGASGDYILSNVGAGSATIAKAQLTLTASADRKVYDGKRSSAGTVTITGLIGGDSASATQAFDTKHAGARTISADGWTIADGNDGGNYAIVKVDAAGTIDAKRLSGALTGLVTKVYDGTDGATVAPINIAGFVAGDVVTLVTDGAHYADRNVGTGKAVTVSGMMLTGDDAGNYLLDSDHAVANIGTITARTVSVGVSGHGAKTYDGTTLLAHSQLGGLAFVPAGDDATTAQLMAADGVTLDIGGVSGRLADRNAGTGKSVTLGGYALSGNGLGNYRLAADTITGIADVARATLEIAASSDTKTYDGTVTSAGSVRITGLVAGDRAGATQAFDDRAAGVRMLKVTGYTLTDGNDGGNYAVRLVDTAGTIARRALAITIADAAKVAGQADPAFGYTLTSGDLLTGDRLHGTLVRDAGEQAGSYAIRPGDLAVSDNYALSVTNGRLTITAAPNGGGTGGNTGGNGGTGTGTGTGSNGGTGTGGNGGTGTAGTGGTGTGGTGTTVTPAVIETALVVADRAVIALPGTTETRNLPHQASGSFESYPGFGWLGKEQMAGNRTVAMRFAIGDLPTRQATDEAAEGAVERSNAQSAEPCQAGARNGSACAGISADRLPYVANQAVSAMIHFVPR